MQVVADLGSLQLSNVVSWLGNIRDDINPAAVLLDVTTLTMRGLEAKVDAEGHTGANIIREYHEGTQVHMCETASSPWCIGASKRKELPQFGNDHLKIVQKVICSSIYSEAFVTLWCCIAIHGAALLWCD